MGILCLDVKELLAAFPIAGSLHKEVSTWLL